MNKNVGKLYFGLVILVISSAPEYKTISGYGGSADDDVGRSPLFQFAIF